MSPGTAPTAGRRKRLAVILLLAGLGAAMAGFVLGFVDVTVMGEGVLNCGPALFHGMAGPDAVRCYDDVYEPRGSIALAVLCLAGVLLAVGAVMAGKRAPRTQPLPN